MDKNKRKFQRFIKQEWEDVEFKDSRAQARNIEDMTWDDYMEWDDIILQRCDALLYLASSEGANIELERAKELNKIIFYNIDDILVLDNIKII